MDDNRKSSVLQDFYSKTVDPHLEVCHRNLLDTITNELKTLPGVPIAFAIITASPMPDGTTYFDILGRCREAKVTKGLNEVLHEACHAWLRKEFGEESFELRTDSQMMH